MELPFRKGKSAEEQARRYLQDQGMQWLDSNFRSKRGEIDLIMRDRETLVFVEVRYRKTDDFGSAAESVNRDKQTKLIAAAQRYLQETHADLPCRFDVVGITGRHNPRVVWIKDAFQTD
jgi:putative endonuclease